MTGLSSSSGASARRQPLLAAGHGRLSDASVRGGSYAEAALHRQGAALPHRGRLPRPLRGRRRCARATGRDRRRGTLGPRDEPARPRPRRRSRSPTTSRARASGEARPRDRATPRACARRAPLTATMLAENVASHRLFAAISERSSSPPRRRDRRDRRRARGARRARPRTAPSSAPAVQARSWHHVTLRREGATEKQRFDALAQRARRASGRRPGRSRTTERREPLRGLTRTYDAVQLVPLRAALSARRHAPASTCAATASAEAWTGARAASGGAAAARRVGPTRRCGGCSAAGLRRRAGGRAPTGAARRRPSSAPYGPRPQSTPRRTRAEPTAPRGDPVASPSVSSGRESVAAAVRVDRRPGGGAASQVPTAPSRVAQTPPAAPAVRTTSARRRVERSGRALPRGRLRSRPARRARSPPRAAVERRARGRDEDPGGAGAADRGRVARR